LLGLNTPQIKDDVIVEESELQSDGTSVITRSFTVLAVDSLTKKITLAPDPSALVELSTERISKNDIVSITGGLAEGNYTFNEMLSDTEFTVNEDIPNAVSGILLFYFPSGASKVGFDNSANFFINKNVQKVLEEIDFREITHEPTGYPERENSHIEFDDATRTFTISPVTESFTFYCMGKKFVRTVPESIQIDDLEGVWFFYYYYASLVATQTPWKFNNHSVFTAILYWDSTNKKSILFGEERHGLVMDWSTHERLHSVDGTQIEPGGFKPINYIKQGDGSSNSHAQIGFTPGAIHDEDIEMKVTNMLSPSDALTPFAQYLGPIAKMPIYYRVGLTSDNVWRRIDATNYPFAWNVGGGPAYYNKYDELTDTWSLEPMTDNYHSAVWVFATNNIYEPLVCVLGQTEAESLILADVSNLYETLKLEKLFTLEFKFLWRILFKTSTSFTNEPKCVLEAITDVTQLIVNNDRYNVTAQYNGNANKGKFLEFDVGISSFDSPFEFPEPSFIRTIILRTVSNSTGVLGVFKKSDPTTPILEINFSGTNLRLNLTQIMQDGDEIYLEVLSGNFTKPTFRMWIQTNVF